MKKHIWIPIACLLSALWLCGCGTTPSAPAPIASLSAASYDADSLEIAGLLEQQRLSWNQADLDGFMELYWKSDSLMFIGKSGITYGWQGTSDRYRKNYPDPAAMGQLYFQIIHLVPMGPSDYLMVGKWQLTREKDIPTGFFTLIWKKINNRWTIVADHTS